MFEREIFRLVGDLFFFVAHLLVSFGRIIGHCFHGCGELLVRIDQTTESGDESRIVGSEDHFGFRLLGHELI